MKTIYLVKDLARATGHSVYTIEHYLREGLIEEFGRSPYTHYRFFETSALDQLKRIRQLRKQGKNLEEIRSLVGAA